MSDELLQRVELFEALRGRPHLKIGSFYWVRAITHKRDSVTGRPVLVDRPPAQWQPARYTGSYADSTGHSWDFLGYETTEGHHFVEVVEIGEEISREAEPESDMEFRLRLIGDLGRMSDSDRNEVPIVTGAALDSIGQRYGFIRGVFGPED